MRMDMPGMDIAGVGTKAVESKVEGYSELPIPAAIQQRIGAVLKRYLCPSPSCATSLPDSVVNSLVDSVSTL